MSPTKIQATEHPTLTTRLLVLFAWASVLLAICLAGREIVDVWGGWFERSVSQ